MKLEEKDDEESQFSEKTGRPSLQGSSSSRRVPWWLAAIIHVSLFLAVYSQTLRLGPRLFSLVGSLVGSLGSHTVKFPWPAENEAFEFRLPIVHPNLVHEQLLLEHTFGDSWGKPAIVDFSPPVDQVEYNRVVLELNTTVDGVQYDRLAHVFVNDIPVWRTSTAEPGNKLVFSTVNKDVSKYLSLFKKSDSTVILQLDNLVRGRLDGAFNTTLTAKYYNVPEEPNNLFHHFTTTSKPAERITQIIKPNPNNKTPLLYYPADALEFSIPKLPRNTTSLKLALYASGNAAEEFWYSNVIESEKHHFKDHGHNFLGHGPVRLVNAYINNVLVSVNAPEPIIYTGGISPALWRPIVGVNAFDIRPYEIDLTAFLPELWDNGLSLDVEITNGTKGGVVGSNWIIAANLLSWESSEIETGFGEVEYFTNSSTLQEFHATTDEDKFFQIVKSSHSSEIVSNLTYVLKNGTELPLEFQSFSDVKFTNGQQYYSYGDSQFLTSAISGTHKTLIKLDGETVGSVLTAHTYPLAISLLTEPISPPNITFEANVTTVYGSRILLGDREVLALESRQNGTSLFTLSPKGNFGHGSTEHVFAAELYPPFPDIKGGAFAKAVNGSLVEFDERYTFTDDDDDNDEDETTAYDLSFLESDDPIVEHIRYMVLSGYLSVDAAVDFIAQSEQFKSIAESNGDMLMISKADNEHKSHFPGLRISLD